jgi:hypothetical protein
MPAASKKPAKKVDDEAGVLEKIAAMPEPYRGYGERMHKAILASAPDLKPKLFYGMPGYAKTGPVLAFFRVDGNLMTFGITEKAHLEVEKGAATQLMPSAWFFTELDDATEKEIAEIARKAAR